MNKEELVKFIQKHVSDDIYDIWCEYYEVLDEYDTEKELFMALMGIVERHLIDAVEEL